MHVSVNDHPSRRRRRRLAVPTAAALALTLGLAACGDDGDDAATTTTEASEEPTTTEADGGAEGETVEVTAVDYAFEGLPERVEVGTTFTLTNESEVELHELVALRLDDDETRSAEEILADPASQEAFESGGPPAMVILAAPGSDTPGPVVGDGSLSEPGRYLMACFVPTGADPDEFLNAPPSDGPPQVEGGPPHFTQGMVAELIVE